MDRRQSLKALTAGTMGTAALLHGCKLMDKKTEEVKAPVAPKAPTTAGPDRTPEEIAHYEKIASVQFFNEHEMTTLSILADIIIPKDEVSGCASDAKVPDFIEFIVKDMPQHQTPMRGGLRWLDLQCLHRYGKSFKECDGKQKIEMVDEIAWPEKAKPEMQQGVSFFNLMRNLTATGFYTSEIGVKDIGYTGNQPNQWNGIPPEVLKQYGLSYTQRDEEVCLKFT